MGYVSSNAYQSAYDATNKVLDSSTKSLETVLRTIDGALNGFVSWKADRDEVFRDTDEDGQEVLNDLADFGPIAAMILEARNTINGIISASHSSH